MTWDGCLFLKLSLTSTFNTVSVALNSINCEDNLAREFLTLNLIFEKSKHFFVSFQSLCLQELWRNFLASWCTTLRPGFFWWFCGSPLTQQLSYAWMLLVFLQFRSWRHNKVIILLADPAAAFLSLDDIALIYSILDIVDSALG